MSRSSTISGKPRCFWLKARGWARSAVALGYRSRVTIAGAGSTAGSETFDLKPTQSTYIPLGVKHRLENLGIEPLRVIEIQSGDYLGEDDIVRFDDVYGRTNDES